jgi:hypothetical protein
MRKIFLKVQAASICQASRVIYGGVGAVLLWRETNASTLGFWYNAVSWLSLLTFMDVGYTATAVDQLTGSLGDGNHKLHRERVAALAAGYFLLTALAVVAILVALAVSGRLPGDWHIFAAIIALASANYAMAINTFQLSLLQSTGNWERTQYLPVIPYLVATSCMTIGLAGVVFPLGALAMSQCILSFGLLLLLDRELKLKGLSDLRLLSLVRCGSDAYRGILQSDVRYYYSIMASAAIMRLAMFVGSLKMKTTDLGDFGRLNQTLVTVISVCFFPINGLANRVIGEVRSGKNSKHVHIESTQLIASAFGFAVAGCMVVLALINQRVSWMGATNVTLYKQALLMVALLFDALAAGIIPVLTYLNRGTYWKDSLALVCVAGTPWVLYLMVDWTDFVWVKVLSSTLVICKIAIDYRRITAS